MYKVAGPEFLEWAESLEQAVEIAAAERECDLVVDLSGAGSALRDLAPNGARFVRSVKFESSEASWLFAPGTYCAGDFEFIQRFQGRVGVHAADSGDFALEFGTQWVVCFGEHRAADGLLPFDASRDNRSVAYYIANFLLCPLAR